MVVLDWAELMKHDLGEQATVPPAALTQGSANPIGFQPGDRATLRDLLYAALLQSDNLAAYTLADFVGHSLEDAATPMSPVDRFVAQMNALARRLHMDRTLFLNPHGLDSIERKLPYSTASDMARLSASAMSKSSFRFYVSQKTRKIMIGHADGTQSSYELQNTNDLLGTNGIDGVKTGKTQRAGECVIISAAQPPESRKEGDNFIITPRRIIVVVLGSMQRFNVASGLINRGWPMYDKWAAAGRPVKRGEAL
jgi:serine-type D-Ala-D-Ala carboxypeptidase (penicillin-binding protein 5/6)